MCVCMLQFIKNKIFLNQQVNNRILLGKATMVDGTETIVYALVFFDANLLVGTKIPSQSKGETG